MTVADALYVYCVYKSLLVITQFFQVSNELLLIPGSPIKFKLSLTVSPVVNFVAFSMIFFTDVKIMS